MKKKKTATLTLLLASVLIIWTMPHVSANKDSAKSMYENALKSSGIVFERFQTLDQTGQDTPDLKKLINIIVDKLNDAKIAFNNEDYDRSLVITRQIQELSVEAKSLADSLLSEPSIRSENIDLRLAITLIEGVIVSIIAYFIWEFLKQNYIKGILNKRPVVVNYEH